MDQEKPKILRNSSVIILDVVNASLAIPIKRIPPSVDEANSRTHMLTHKNERPHVCPHCGKDFTRQHDWKRHMELHDPSKKFKCAGFLADGRPWGCNKEFARKDALSRHFKSQQVLSFRLLSPYQMLIFAQGRQCIEEVLLEGRTMEELYEAQGITMGHLSGNSSEDMYEDN